MGRAQRSSQVGSAPLREMQDSPLQQMTEPVQVSWSLPHSIAADGVAADAWFDFKPTKNALAVTAAMRISFMGLPFST